MQDALKAQNAVIGFTALQEDQVFVIARLVRAQTALNKVQGASPQVNAGRAGTQGITAQNVAMNQQVVISRDLQAGLHQLTGESILYNQRMATLVATFGSAGEASGLLIASGITMNQMLDTNQNHWLQVLQQVGATQVAYQTMGQTMGMLGADMNALNIMASDQVTQMTKVNQALDGVHQIGQGGQSTFLLFEQALQGIGTAAGATGASMKGIGPNSVALRLAWQTAYTAGFKLLDALRMMTAISPGASKGSFPQLTRAMKDSLAQLLPMGRQSTATRAQMVSLANSINPAITNFKQLTTWIGNIKHPGKDLNDLLASMGLNMQDLAKDAASLSTTMQTQMNAVFSSAKLAASGVDGAVKKLGTDMGATHPNFKQIQGDAQVLYDKLVRNHVMSRQVARDFVTALDPAFHDTGRAAGNSGAAHQVGIFAGSMSNAQKIADTFVHRSPYHVQVIETGKGTFSVSQGGIFAKTSPGSPALAHPAAPGAAGGMFVPGSGQGDTVPAWLTPGEVVVPKGMVRAGAVDHLRGRVPGFAAGGMVGNLGVMNGQATTMFHHQFVNRFTKAMESAMTSAMRSAISAAMSTAAAGSPGGGVQRWRGLVLRALGMEGLSLGLVNDVLYQMQTESGGNPNAINLTDVNARNGDPSRGLMQTIATTFSAYHWPGTSWDIFDPFANIAAAINYGAHNGRGFGSGPGQIGSGHGYSLGGKVMDSGGWLAPGATMVRNNTGRAEHLVPTTGRHGGDVHIHGDLNVREQADAYLIARSLAFQLDA
jgi:hypothetical protein